MRNVIVFSKQLVVTEEAPTASGLLEAVSDSNRRGYSLEKC